MKRYEDLKQLLAHIWSTVQQGAEQPDHPYHAPAFATAGEDGPSVRTVILRSVDPQASKLIFHSDRRAQKIQEIQRHQRVSWMFWDASSKEQLRFRGEATLHFDDQLADRVWYDSHPKSLKLYVKPLEPDTQVESPRSGVTEAVSTAHLDNHKQVEAGRKHFAVVCTHIDEVDFLHLHPEGNYRARYTWNSHGVTSAWIIP